MWRRAMANSSRSSKSSPKDAGRWRVAIFWRVIASRPGESFSRVMTAPARTAAYHALRAIAAGRADLPTALHASRAAALPTSATASLAAEIVTGTLRWQRSLDHLIEHFSQAPHRQARCRSRRHPAPQPLSTPAPRSRAGVSGRGRCGGSDARGAKAERQRVSSTRCCARRCASGTSCRCRHGRPDADDRDAALAYLGITHSHPDWLVARWLDRYGFDATERWVQFNNETPPLTLRVNRLRATREEAMAALAADGVETEPTRYRTDGLVVTRGNPLRRPADGLVFVQDEASQLVPAVVAARPGERVLDLCASPGGKTIAMAADMDDAGAIVASDVRPRRLALLRDTVRDSGASQCVASCAWPPTGPLPFAARSTASSSTRPAPASARSGGIPDIRWRRREEDLACAGPRSTRAACCAQPTSCGRWTARLCHLLERARRERRRRRRVPRERDATSRSSISARSATGCLRHSSTPRDASGRRPPAHGLEAFFAALSCTPVA